MTFIESDLQNKNQASPIKTDGLNANFGMLKMPGLNGLKPLTMPSLANTNGNHPTANGNPRSRNASPGVVGGRKHTPSEVLSQMHDISGTITELMHENVYLRTKLLSAKSSTWKSMFVSLDSMGFGVAGIFTQWAILTKSEKQERLKKKHLQEAMGWAEDTEKRFSDLQSQNSLQLVILQAKLDKVTRERDDQETDLGAKVEKLQKELDDEKRKNRMFSKAFHSVHDSLSKAATEFLDEHGHTVDTKQFNIHHPESDKPGEAGKAETEYKDVSEFLVEQLHAMLHTVDGRYVRPLSIGLPKRNVNGQKFTDEQQAAMASGGLVNTHHAHSPNNPLLSRRSVPAIAAVNMPPATFVFTADGDTLSPKPVVASGPNSKAPVVYNNNNDNSYSVPATNLNMSHSHHVVHSPNAHEIVPGASKVILIQNALQFTEGVTQSEEFVDVVDDMEMGCSEYAKPLNTKIVKPEHVKRLNDHGIDWVQPGWVFCQFRSVEDSGKVFAEMQEGDYDGQILKLSYYELERFTALLPLLNA